jgi:hypothetical protein
MGLFRERGDRPGLLGEMTAAADVADPDSCAAK